VQDGLKYDVVQSPMLLGRILRLPPQAGSLTGYCTRTRDHSDVEVRDYYGVCVTVGSKYFLKLKNII